MHVCDNKAVDLTCESGYMPLRELQLYRFGILDDIASICDKHGIKYILQYGTLLGAIRHEGFIPRDDDIDIAVPWNDYRRLIAVLNKEYSDKYFAQNYRTDSKFPLLWTQVRVNGTTNMPIAYYDHDIHWGMCIDVFPLVYADSDLRKREKMQKAIGIAESMLERERVEMIHGQTRGRRQRLINLLPCRLRRWIVSVILKAYAHEPEESGLVIALEEPQNIFQMIFAYSDIMLTEKHVFEGRMFSIPKGYDGVLKTVYGDYLTLPPEEQRVGHEGNLGTIINDIHKDYKDYQAELRRGRPVSDPYADNKRME